MTLSEVLRKGRQFDPDGEEVVMSRQACEEAANLIEILEGQCDEAKEHLLAIAECNACVAASLHGPSTGRRQLTVIGTRIAHLTLSVGYAVAFR